MGSRVQHTHIATGVAALRIAVGTLLALAPRSMDRAAPGAAPASASAILLTRTVGIRDLGIGLGTLLAARSGAGRDLQRWMRIGLLSDVLDVVAAAADVRQLGKRAVISALIPLPVILADLYVVASGGASPSALDSSVQE